MVALAADAGVIAALSAEHIRVAGVGVAPAQVVLQRAAQDGVVAVVRSRP